MKVGIKYSLSEINTMELNDWKNERITARSHADRLWENNGTKLKEQHRSNTWNQNKFECTLYCVIDFSKKEKINK